MARANPGCGARECRKASFRDRSTERKTHFRTRVLRVNRNENFACEPVFFSRTARVVAHRAPPDGAGVFGKLISERLARAKQARARARVAALNAPTDQHRAVPDPHASRASPGPRAAVGLVGSSTAARTQIHPTKPPGPAPPAPGFMVDIPAVGLEALRQRHAHHPRRFPTATRRLAHVHIITPAPPRTRLYGRFACRRPQRLFDRGMLTAQLFHASKLVIQSLDRL